MHKLFDLWGSFRLHLIVLTDFFFVLRCYCLQVLVNCNGTLSKQQMPFEALTVTEKSSSHQ